MSKVPPFFRHQYVFDFKVVRSCGRDCSQELFARKILDEKRMEELLTLLWFIPLVFQAFFCVVISNVEFESGFPRRFAQLESTCPQITTEFRISIKYTHTHGHTHIRFYGRRLMRTHNRLFYCAIVSGHKVSGPGNYEVLICHGRRAV